MLIYVGDGAFRAGIPARDLTDEEVKRFGGEQKLIETGLYAKPKPQVRTDAKASENKEA